MPVETKLTLSMEKEVIEEAKRYAREKNTSLSRLIKTYLVSITRNKSEKDTDITPLVKSLSGVLSVEKKAHYKKEYSDYLQKKYK
jgi:Family of unknown function (DUF6364)